jgi:phage gp45-like
MALIAICGLALALAGCGGSTSANLAPTPTGSFTNANFAGTYAFEVTGSYLTGTFFGAAGTLHADGNGNITSGTEDIVSTSENSSGAMPIANVAITGTYTVGADGRGTATLNSAVGAIGFDFVLLSSGQRGLVIRFDTGASASGTLDLQDTTAFSAAALSGPFAFNLSGIDSLSYPMSSVGTFSADGVSVLSNGLQDTNDIVSGTTLNSPFSGTYTVASNGRGIATLTTISGAQQAYAFYVVNASHLKVIEIDSSLQGLAGDAFRQPSSFSNGTVSGPFAFTLSGNTSSLSALAPYISAGLFAADGGGNITSGVEDINNGGRVSKDIAVTGNYTLAATGRGTLTLSGSAGISNFVFYPTASFGLQMMEIDPSPVVSGTAFAQQAGTYSNGSLQTNYGFNISGVSSNSGGEVDAIALISGNGSGNFTGAADFNFTEELARQLEFNGTYSLAANGRGTATLTSSDGTQNFTFYAVSPSQLLLVETDTGLIAGGTMLQQ